jgi:hypothetical protein
MGRKIGSHNKHKKEKPTKEKKKRGRPSKGSQHQKQNQVVNVTINSDGGDNDKKKKNKFQDAIQSIPNMIFNPSLSIFSIISGITSQSLQSTKVTSVQSNIESNSIPERYFSSKINIKPTIIKEISKDTYDSLQGNSLYQTTFIGPTQSIDQAEKQLPGLKTWLSV